jgi:hypothetical protein
MLLHGKTGSYELFTGGNKNCPASLKSFAQTHQLLQIPKQWVPETPAVGLK